MTGTGKCVLNSRGKWRIGTEFRGSRERVFNYVRGESKRGSRRAKEGLGYFSGDVHHWG